MSYNNMDTKGWRWPTRLIFLLLFDLEAEVLREKKAKPVTPTKGLSLFYFESDGRFATVVSLCFLT